MNKQQAAANKVKHIESSALFLLLQRCVATYKSASQVDQRMLAHHC